MKITKRSENHLVKTQGGFSLLATRKAANLDWQFPPSEYYFGEKPDEEILLGPKGVLYTYSIVHVDPRRGPYALAMVDFEPGVRAFGLLLFSEGQELNIGSLVKVVPHNLPDGTEDYAFALLEGYTS
jgi:uncharacterized OB-fold protein